MENDNIFAQRLTEIRKLNNLTQQKLGEAVGTHKQAVNNWEKGVAFPNLQLFVKLCRLLDCSADYLCGLSDLRERLP